MEHPESLPPGGLTVSVLAAPVGGPADPESDGHPEPSAKAHSGS